MEAIKWGTSPDGEYEVVSLTKETFEGGMEIMRKGFFVDETVSVACELYNNPEAVEELEELCLHAAEDGVSLIAIEKSSGKIAAAAFNIYESVTDDPQYLSDFQNKCETPEAKSLVQFMIDMGQEFDILGHYNVDTLVEIMFLATMKEHRGHGLAKLLFECTIEMCRKLQNGEDVRRTVVDEQPLEALRKPHLVTALCSSFITQKITQKLGFENKKMVSFTKWSFNGKTFAEVIGPSTTATSIDCFVL